MSFRYVRMFVFLSAVFLLLFSAQAQAATITVTNTNDNGAGSLRQAILGAGSGDIINFSFAYPATITTTSGALIIDKSLTITGPGVDDLTVGTTGSNSVFRILGANIQVTISGLTVTGGNSPSGGGGGIYAEGDLMTLTLQNCKVFGNTAAYGGGVYVLGGGNLTAADTEISNNTATTLGGGICFASPNASSTLERVTVHGNSAVTSGGGIYYEDDYGTSHKLIMTDCSVTANVAQAVSGGGIYIYNPDLEMTRCEFSNNVADDYGGGLYQHVTSSGVVTLNDCLFQSNTVQTYSGGGARIIRANINNCLFEGNQGPMAGGLSLSAGTIQDSIFRSNSATGDSLNANGGGLTLGGYNGLVEVRVIGCLFESNYAKGLGGGACLYGWSPIFIQNTTFHGNMADGSGGGGIAIKYITGNEAEVNLSFVTITGNTGDYDCTAAGGDTCEADPGGGGIYVQEQTTQSFQHVVRLKSCVIAKNKITQKSPIVQPQFYADLSKGTFQSVGYNFIGRKGDSTIGFTDGVNNDQVGGGLLALDPKLMDLGDYGGPTFSRPPMKDSPLINAGGPALDVGGAAVNVDQRGEKRPSGSACDIGAVETLSPSIVPVLMMLLE
jgi:predicted outer membrane repeat protein